MKHLKTIAIVSCITLVSLLTFTACNLDAGQGIFSAISESEPSLDTTNQSILGFDGNYAFIKAQDGVYKYGQSNSDVARLNLSLTTNGFATTIGDVVNSKKFVYQDRDNIYQVYDITGNTPAPPTLPLSAIKAMNNGIALSGDVDNYTITSLPSTEKANLTGTDSAGIMFGFVDNALTTMITDYKNANNVTVYDFSYYWNDKKLEIKDNADKDLEKLVELNLETNHGSTTKTNFIRIQAFQPATTEGPGVAIAKIANDSYTSLLFVQMAPEGDLEYVGQSNFYLNYNSAYAVPSARVKIGNEQYMLVPYSSGLRLIDMSTATITEKDKAIAAIKTSAIDDPTKYAYASSNTTSFARGFNYNNVVDIKPIPDPNTSAASKTKYLVSTVNSGVYTITLPSEVGTPSDDTKNGSREIGYQPIVNPTP